MLGMNYGVQVSMLDFVRLTQDINAIDKKPALISGSQRQRTYGTGKSRPSAKNTSFFHLRLSDLPNTRLLRSEPYRLRARLYLQLATTFLSHFRREMRPPASLVVHNYLHMTEP
jgi:hypothetical protein